MGATTDLSIRISFLGSIDEGREGASEGRLDG